MHVLEVEEGETEPEFGALGEFFDACLEHAFDLFEQLGTVILHR